MSRYSGGPAPDSAASGHRLVVGLGNPGARYARTRHNLGFDVLDLLAANLGVTFRPGLRGLLAQITHRGRQLWLLKPSTFMNLSGQAVAPLARRKGILPSAVLVVHDDLDLPPGRLRFRSGGGAGGHRGVASITECLGVPDFDRLKLGIGRPPQELEPMEYVLCRPGPEECVLLSQATDRAAAACLLWAAEGIQAAANEFNQTAAGDPASPPGEVS